MAAKDVKKYTGSNLAEVLFDPAKGARDEYINQDVKAQKERDAAILAKEAAEPVPTDTPAKTPARTGLKTGRAARKKRARASLLANDKPGLSETLG